MSDRRHRTVPPAGRRPGARLAPRAGAFTLLEVVLAVALALGLLTSLLAFHARAASARQRVLEQLDALSAERRLMDRRTGELRGAITYPFLQFGLRGEPDRITFLSACLPSAASWSPAPADEAPRPPEHGLQMIGYRPRVETDEEGVDRVVGLERTCQKVIAARTAEEGKEIAVALIAPQVRFVQFRYWDGGAWAPTWSEGSLPAAVEVALGREALPVGVAPEDYPYDLARRVIHLPAAGAGPARQGTGGAAGGQP